MKKILLGVAVAAMTLASGAAMAQPYGGYYDRGASYRDSDRDGRSDASEWNRDRDRDGRPDQYDRNDNRRGNGHGYGHGYGRGNGHAYSHDYRGNGRWRQGQVYPYWRDRGYYVSDYRRYNLPPPRAGYRYYRSDNGDVVMAAIASGLIGAIVAGGLNDHDRYDRHDGYDRSYGYRR